MGRLNDGVQQKSTACGPIFVAKSLISNNYVPRPDPLATVIISRYVSRVIGAIVS